MKKGKLVINGHYKRQRVTGVQRYANEIVTYFQRNGIDYSWVDPPPYIISDIFRHLWMQSVMPVKVPSDKLLWSPTNIGPVMCENQVLTLHDIADQLHPQWFDDQYVQWRKMILPRLLRGVRRVITVSEYSKETIVSRFPQTENKIEVVYNGVRTDHFYPRSEQEIEQVRRDLKLEKPFVLSVGSLEERKNIRGLIEAWEQLPPQIRDEYELVITGESARKFAFKLDKQPSESISFTGYVQDAYLPVLYTEATVFAYPSLFEGFGLPVLEAMACGTAVITSSTTSLKELAKDKAMVVDPEDFQALAEALQKMIESSELRAGYEQKGRDYAPTFRWEDSGRQTIKILEDCII